MDSERGTFTSADVERFVVNMERDGLDGLGAEVGKELLMLSVETTVVSLEHMPDDPGYAQFLTQYGHALQLVAVVASIQAKRQVYNEAAKAGEETPR